MTDTTAQPATPEWRNLLGICAAISEDLGFDPLGLRIAFAVPLIWRPEIVLLVYFAAGLVVLVSRLAYPARAREVAAEPIDFVLRLQPESLVALPKAA